ncbi:hypothetical protein MTO96_030205, partial [Rhipicephalus appendiculatus]
IQRVQSQNGSSSRSSHTWVPPGPLMDIHKGRSVRLQVRVQVPVKDHPNFNFVGKLLGPKGNSLKRLQEETQTKMAILGRGFYERQSERRGPAEAEGPQVLAPSRGVARGSERVRTASRGIQAHGIRACTAQALPSA